MSLSSRCRAIVTGAIANKAVAKELMDQADAALGSHKMVAVIVASSTSATTNFGALAVGDVVMHVPGTPGAMGGGVVTTAGTNPLGAAVVGDTYVVTRAVPAVAAAVIV